jgi:hypothetical protein
MPPDEIAANGRQIRESARLRLIPFGGIARAIIAQKLRPGVLAGSKEDGIGVLAGLVG